MEKIIKIIKILILFMVFFLTVTRELLSSDIFTSIKNGNSVRIGVLGNSIACGQSASTLQGRLFDTSEMLNGNYATLKNDLLPWDAPASMLTGFGIHSPVEGWVNQLWSYLLLKNYSSEIINLCGSGWDTGDQLGIYSTRSGKAPVYNNVNALIKMQPKLDAVLLPLQVNDWVHGQGLDFFKRNTKQIILALLEVQIQVIIVLENPVYNNSYAKEKVADNYNADIVNKPGDYYFTMAAREIASSFNLKTMDLWSPIHKKVLKLKGKNYGIRLAKTGLFEPANDTSPVHPNQKGHDIMAKAAISFFK